MHHRPCNVPGCPRPRRRFGRLCVRHARRLTLHGSPTARLVPSKSLTPYALQALKLFRDYPAHPGLTVATEELSSLLADSLRRVQEGEVVTGDVIQFARLAAATVEPRHILALQAAVGLFDRDQPTHIVDQSAYVFAVARAVCSLSPRGSGKARVPLGAKALAGIGSLLVERYARLAAAVVSHFDSLHVSQRARADALGSPFGALPNPMKDTRNV